MPEIRIFSWNSTGEDAIKAGQICDAQNQLRLLHPGHPEVDIFLIQEAQQVPGGAISAMINTHPAPAGGRTIGPNYNRPAVHISEMLAGPGRGYICISHNRLTVINPLQLKNYSVDPSFVAWRGTLSAQQSNSVNDVVRDYRPPAYTTFRITPGGADIFLITWHAPLGISHIIPGMTMPRGALLDSYLILENSFLLNYARAQVAAKNGVVIIAGDLNTNDVGLSTDYLPGITYIPLDNFSGFSHNLDHILAWQPAGPIPGNPPVSVVEGYNSMAGGTHEMMSALVRW